MGAKHLPHRMSLSKLFHNFFNSQKAGGLILVFVTILSLAISNSAFQEQFQSIWNYDVGGHTIVQWINDGLMAIFFLLIGLELEREIYNGELSSLKNASLPIFGAMGGMLVPAAIFMMFNYGTISQAGVGIPMATDIAFAIGILSLLGSRVPASLKMFLMALAVIDDLGAIIVIALFYTKTVIVGNLLIAFGIMGFLFILNRLKVYNLIPYLLGGLVMWYFMLQSGVHATITGVLLAFVIPFGKGDEKSPSYILQDALDKPVAFFILPLFALANTSIVIAQGWHESLWDANSLGIMAGLVVGKPFGVLLFSFIGVSLGLCILPGDLKWKHIFGAGILAGIGFTMSIFITLLAYNDPALITNSKIAILCASLIAGAVGFLWLRLTLKKNLA